MENTIKTIKMTNPIRGLVSKRRKRYTQDGFNLDLTYIGDRIIAMGFPAEKLEAVYRNRLDEVVKFLDLKHLDSYKIYNLCSERSYDVNKFKRAAAYPFDDHNPPNIELIESFCKDVHQWLCENKKNVAAVHCKAGKGRTGTMICCYMLYSGQFETASEALNYYGQQRTHDKKGVTIPSQRRYVEYYSQLLKNEKPYDRNVCLQIIEMKMKPPPSFPSHQGPINFTISDIDGRKLHCAEFKNKSQDGYILIRLDCCVPLRGDAKVEFSCKNMMRKEKLFHFWLNTYFVNENALVASDGYLNLTLNKSELDDAHKDKQNKVYPSDFKLEILLQKIPSKRYSDPVNRHSTPARILSCGNNNRHSSDGQQTNNHHINNHNMYNNHNHHHNNHLPHIHSQPNHLPIHAPPLQHSQSLTTTTCDANTPSDSSENEASSSAESSTEEEGWESGELLALVPQYYPKSDNYYYGSCTSSSSSYNHNIKSNLNDTSNNISSNNSNSITNTTKIVTESSNDLENGDTIKIKNPNDNSHKLNHLTTTSSNSNNGKIKITPKLTTLSPTSSSSTNTSSQRTKTKQFKMKSNNIKSTLTSTSSQFGSSPTAGSHPLKIVCTKSKVNKLRWLTNMRSDPDLKETLTKSVKIRPSNAIPITTATPVAKTKSTPSNDNLLSIDYYSSLCDKQLSFESPCKSPGSHMIKMLKKTLEGDVADEEVEEDKTDIQADLDLSTTSIVVAKPIVHSSDKIGFNVKASSSQEPIEIMLDSKNQKNNLTVMIPPGENRFCNRILSHFTNNSKKQDSPNKSNANNDLNVTPSCLSPAAVPRINRCTPFSFREIRQELQSVMKSQNQKSPQQNKH